MPAATVHKVYLKIQTPGNVCLVHIKKKKKTNPDKYNQLKVVSYKNLNCIKTCIRELQTNKNCEWHKAV